MFTTPPSPPRLLLLRGAMRPSYRAQEAWGSGGDEYDQSPIKHPYSMEEIGVPFAGELFSAEEALLLGRGKRDAEQKRELALQK